MLQETLKQATKKNHDELEQLMYVNDIMSGNLSLQQYKGLLTTNYLVHKTFEDVLYTGLSVHLADKLELDKRIKLPSLIADLHELQMTEPDFDVFKAQNISLNKNDAGILGALYVLEGATLGGSVIVKKLQTNVHLNKLNLGFHYYQVYGPKLITYWKNFCEVLNQQPADTYDIAVQGAQKMFGFIAAAQQTLANIH